MAASKGKSLCARLGSLRSSFSMVTIAGQISELQLVGTAKTVREQKIVNLDTSMFTYRQARDRGV